MRAAIDSARDRAAAALGVGPGGLVFCSSGTEAVNLALLGTARKLAAGHRVVTWAGEHQAVLGAVRRLQLEGRPVTVLAVDGGGRAQVGRLPPDTGLISIGLANNETGVLQPVADAVAEAGRLGAILHLDACQGPRWVRPPLGGCHLASFSGAKLGAGRGGLLWVQEGVRLEPLQYGGPQEWGLRAGAADPAGAVAVAAALAATTAERDRRAPAAALQARRLQAVLEELGGEPLGNGRRLPNFAVAAFDRVRGEDLLLALDLLGVAASSGAACASGALDPSHVLLAMGFSLEAALGSLRLTSGYATTDAEIEVAAGALRAALSPLVTHAP